MYKQVIVIRDDISLSRGKIAAQASHASLEAYRKAPKKIVKEWEKMGQKKVVLKAKGIEELLSLRDKCRKLKLPFALITDAGRTETKAGTITALGIGPEKEENIDKVTGSLPLLK